MHEIGFDHTHVTPEEREHIADVIWSADNVELTTVGIDIGSSTSHLMFARVRLQRLSEALSSRFVVVERKILWRSPIRLTPYVAGDRIDADALGRFVRDCYGPAGLSPERIDTGAVILTGEALKKRNARAIARLFAKDAGRFVCASAGHHLEAALAAHGSGAVALSRQKQETILNVDVGGGTTKLALCHGGRLLHSAAIAVGGRLVTFDAAGRIDRIEEPARHIARATGTSLAPGRVLEIETRHTFVRAMVDALFAVVRREPPRGLTRELMLTPPLPATPMPDAIAFSGGVSEFLFGREAGEYGDLGRDMADAIAESLRDGGVAREVYDPGDGIRSTVIGAAQFTVQVSGNTISISEPAALPMRDLPVAFPNLDLGAAIDPNHVAGEIGKALERLDLVDGAQPVALALRWRGDPAHPRLQALAAGICGALPKTLADRQPLILLIDGDVGMTLGRLIEDELEAPGNVISIDALQLQEFDYVDVGRTIQPTNVVPVIIKSLLFQTG